MSSEGPRGEKRKWEDRSGGGGNRGRGGFGRGGNRGGGFNRGGGRGGAGGSNGGDRNCFNCQKPGHRASDCTEPKTQRDTGDRVCFNCQKPGHRSSECTEARAPREGHTGGDRNCFNCQKPGHRASDCPEPRVPRDGSGRGGGSFRGGRGDNPNNMPLGSDKPRFVPRGERFIPEEPSPEEIPKLIAASKLDLTTVRPGCDEISTEQSVGMTQFLNSTPPFTGMFKAKQWDFQVYEIGQDGNVAHLKDLTVPKETHKDPAAVLPASPEGEAALAAVIGQDTVTQFVEWCEVEKKRVEEWHALHPRPKKPPGGEFIVHMILSKAGRTAIHDIVRQYYPYLVSDAVNADYVSKADSTTEVVQQPYVSAASLIQDTAEVEHPNKKQKGEDGTAVPVKDEKKTEPAAAATPATLPNRKIRLRFAVMISKTERDGRSHAPWPRDRPDYLKFTLYKENLGTMEALQILTNQLRLNMKLFGFAGTKDKRAITVQYITAYKVPAEKFKHLTQAGMGKFCLAKAGDFQYVPQPLRLGDLEGNEFRLVIRNVKGIEEPALNDLLHQISLRGFLNYYGLQRFGTSAIGTHAIGRALLKKDFQEAIALILMPRTGERSDITAAREYFVRTRDIPGTLARMPGFMKLEQDVLRVLLNHGWNAYQNALESIPRAMRLMYVHAYQSYVWNQMATKRIELDSLHVVEGDLVVVEKGTKSSTPAAAAPVPSETDSSPLDVDPSTSSESKEEEAPIIDDPVAEEAAAEPTFQKEDILVLTADDVASGKYRLSDIVLPLPGYDVVYPKNAIGDEYAKALSNDGVVFLPYQSGPGATMKDFCLAGNYRKIIQLPKCMRWTLQKYTDLNAKLHEPTDWEMIQEKRKKEQQEREAAEAAMQVDSGNTDGTPAANASVPWSTAPNPLTDPTVASSSSSSPHLLALNLSFQLPSSTYATMLLRELMKVDTTTENQKAMAVEHRKDEEAKMELEQSDTNTRTGNTLEQEQPEATPTSATAIAAAMDTAE